MINKNKVIEMTNVQKENIKSKLAAYCEKYDSQNKAANSLKGVSSATISHVLRDIWEDISDEMWLKIGKQVGYTMKDWVYVETRNYKFLTELLKDAAAYANVFGVIGDAGTGKSQATKDFTSKHKRAYRLECNEYWNRNQFLKELLAVIGRPNDGLNIHEMMSEVVRTLKTQENPVIVLDEFDKVDDKVLAFFITMYNQLEDQCGLILLATDHLKKRIDRGLRLNKKGYKEVYSRLGRKFVELPGVNSTDVTQACKANGITDHSQIKDILESCENDLRRVRRKVHAYKQAA